MIVYFIRHTRVDVPQGTCYGQSDVPLRDTFQEEAAVVKQKISGVVFDRVFTSPLTRCVELARFCGFPDAEREDLVKEFNFGEWEMGNYDQLYRDDPRFVSWCNDYLHEHAPGGESLLDVVHRTELFLTKLKSMDCGCAAVFCHGGILASALILTGKTTPEHAMDNVPPYGTVMALTIER